MSFPQHIVVLNVFFAPNSYGGATIIAEQVARELVHRHGRRITAISAMNRPELAPYAVMKVEKDGIRNYLINMPKRRSYAEVYDNPKVAGIVSDLLDMLQPDLVHAHCLQDIGAGVLSRIKQRGVPVVLSVHDFWWICERQFMIRPDQRYCGQDPVKIEDCRGCVADLPRAKTRQSALLAEAAQVDVITFPSQFAHDLSVRSGMTAARMVVWENGVSLPLPGFFEAQAGRRAQDKRLVFGYLGGPSQIKGWPLLKPAFQGLNRDDFAGYLVEGSLDGTWWNGLNLSRLKGDWRIHPRFHQDQMDAFYARIDVLLFLSQWKETFGLAIREAAARGIRVLQTDSGGTTEWAGAQPETMLRIGDGPEVLRDRIERLLKAGADHPAPLANVTSHADQAQAFLALTAPLG